MNRKVCVYASVAAVASLWGWQAQKQHEDPEVSGNFNDLNQVKTSDGKIWPAIVIGAGVSGLTTAGMLSSRGIDVLVLEARDSVHGRTFTHRFPSTSTLPAADVDLGANYIHAADDEQPIYQLAQRLGVKAPIANGAFWMDTATARWFNAETAEELPMDSIASLHLLHSQIWHLIDLVPESLLKQFSLLQAFRAAQAIMLEKSERNLTQVEEGILDTIRIKNVGYVSDFAEMVAESPQVPSERDLSEATGLVSTDVDAVSIEDLLGAMRLASTDVDAVSIGNWKKFHAKRLSVANMSRPLERSEEEVFAAFKSVDRLNVNGYVWLVDYLKDQIPQENILLNMSAKSVELTTSGLVRVRVRGPEENDMLQFMGHRVVVTAPLGVLKGADSSSSIAFSPQLSDRHASAISMGGMGTHNKVILRFGQEAKFWPNVGNFLSSDSRFQWLNLDYYGQRGTLVAHVFPPYAYDMLSLQDETILREVLLNLQGMFKEVPEPEQFLVVKWNADPYARGSYSFTARGTTDKLREAFHYPHPSEANPRVHFAGEHTEIDNQCVSSAYFSALRTGNCLLEQVFGQQPGPNEQFPSSSRNSRCPWSTNATYAPTKSIRTDGSIA